MNVNLDAAGQADYAQMAADGCAVIYVGTATFKGGLLHRPTGSIGDYTCDRPSTSPQLAEDGEFPPVLQVADLVRQLPEPRQ